MIAAICLTGYPIGRASGALNQSTRENGMISVSKMKKRIYIRRNSIFKNRLIIYIQGVSGVSNHVMPSLPTGQNRWCEAHFLIVPVQVRRYVLQLYYEVVTYAVFFFFTRLIGLL